MPIVEFSCKLLSDLYSAEILEENQCALGLGAGAKVCLLLLIRMNDCINTSINLCDINVYQ